MCEKCGLKVPEGETAEAFATRFCCMQERAQEVVAAVFGGWLAELASEHHEGSLGPPPFDPPPDEMPSGSAAA